jgi:hypothetical protein
MVGETKKGLYRLAALILLIALVNVPQPCLADRGGWNISTEPVTLTESGQKAIIGWDGQTEVLCLATDVSSSRQAIVIEFLPLPSEPKVTLGSRETFDVVQKVLARRGVRFVKERGGFFRGLGKAGGDSGEPFTITFHERLGAHDVTVLKVNQPNEFANWVEEKAKALTQNQASIPDNLRKLIAKYLNDYRCPYFVFDVIEVGPDPKSVDPIIYEFQYWGLFYPLEISSTFHGKTSIDLIVFSEERINPDPLIRLGFQNSTVGRVNSNDLQETLPRLKELLGETALAQAFRYSGDVRRLTGNIVTGLRRDNLAYTSGEYSKAQLRSFYSGMAAAIYTGVLITFASLWPMYFAAKRQKPRWWLRLLAGFLLGMPLGVVLSLVAIYILDVLRDLFQLRYYYELMPTALVEFSMCVGFIIFCFQLGLRKRWYLWGLVYACLSIPATFISNPNKLEHIFDFDIWGRLWKELQADPVFILCLLVFSILFLIAKLIVWPMYFAAKRQKPRWFLRLLAGFLLGMPLGFGLIFAIAYMLENLLNWKLFLYRHDPVILSVCSMGIGFIIFCFQLGLQKRWYLWGLVYACLSIPSTFISNPDKLERIFDFDIWGRLWKELQTELSFILCLLVFSSLFLIARLLIWITDRWQRNQVSRGNQIAE